MLYTFAVATTSSAASGNVMILEPTGDTVSFTLADRFSLWFWEPGWLSGEREASEDIVAGRFTRFTSDESFLNSLDS